MKLVIDIPEETYKTISEWEKPKPKYAAEYMLYDFVKNGKVQQPCDDCRNCQKWSECECGEKGHANGTSIGYAIGECKEYVPCDDAISRQAVLNTLYSMDKALDENRTIEEYKELLKECYEQLPPAKVCDDAVSRQDIINRLERVITDGMKNLNGTHSLTAERLLKTIKELPSVSVAEKVGEWVWKRHAYRCSLCGFFPWLVEVEEGAEIFTDLERTNAYKYCPHCGAKMAESEG